MRKVFDRIAESITDSGLIVILRQIPVDRLSPGVSCLEKAGVRVVEVAMNSPEAPEQIQMLRKAGFCVGAGTVLEREQAERAIRAGAQFLFSPMRTSFFLQFCRERQILGVPGALTPTEVYNLSQEGVKFIKLFPAALLGPEYMRQLLAPCPFLRLIPTGGVTLPLAEQYLSGGAAAVAVGSEIINLKLVQTDGRDEIMRRAQSFVELAKRYRSKRAQYSDQID